MSEIKPFIAGNWKMNGTKAEALALVGDLKEKYEALAEKYFEMLVCPPFTLIDTVATQLNGSGIAVGVKNESLL